MTLVLLVAVGIDLTKQAVLLQRVGLYLRLNVFECGFILGQHVLDVLFMDRHVQRLTSETTSISHFTNSLLLY